MEKSQEAKLSCYRGLRYRDSFLSLKGQEGLVSMLTTQHV